MNKNLVIGILAAMLVLGSLWGQVGNKSKKALQREREAVVTQLSQVEAEAAKTHDALLAKTANLQKTLQVKEQQLVKARQELVGLRKGGKALEAQISERDAAVTTLTQEKNRLAGQINKMKKSLAATAAASTTLAHEKNRLAGQVNKMKKSLAATAGSGQQQVAALQQQMAGLQTALQEKEQQLAAAAEAIEETRAVKKELHSSVEQGAQNTEELQAKLEKAEIAVQELQEQLAVAEAAADQSKIAREYETVRAQVIGLEKIVEEKNATIEETSKELDRWKVNMDVLLTRISEQQDTQQELREENRELVKELAAKNEELADVNEQLIQTPVQQ